MNYAADEPVLIQYFFFTGHGYYPLGGMNDYRGSMSAKSDVDAMIIGLRLMNDLRHDWVNVARLGENGLEMVKLTK